MKALKYIGTLFFLLSTFLVIHLFSDPYLAEHPSLNETSTFADLYLGNVKYYNKENSTDRSLIHLKRAIATIQKLQTDIDPQSKEILDEQIEDLFLIADQLENGKISSEQINGTFETILNTLARAELKVSEKYAESNRVEISKVALEYAKMHLKASLVYSNKVDFDIERHIYYEIDSILTAEPMAAVIATEKIDHIIDEMDRLISSNISMNKENQID